jgi:hypothetical protein
MTLPDFLVIGAQKSGTTSLYTYLRQHPGLCLSPKKEPHFFCGPGGGTPPAWTGPVDRVVLGRSIFDPARYAELFADAGDRPTGEMSTGYLVDPAVPARVVAANPEVRVVVLLRDPVLRAYSSWWMWRRSRWDGLDFAAALAAEDDRLAQGWGWHYAYRRTGMYGEHLTRWRAAVGADRLLAVRSTDLDHDRLETVQRIFAFLGVDPAFVPDVAVVRNVADPERLRAGRADGPGGPDDRSGPPVRLGPAKRLVGAAVRTTRTLRTGVRTAPPERPALDPGLRATLDAQYAEDRVRTAEMLGWDDWADPIRSDPI